MRGGETMNKIKKGFTLLELIIVMAIFSILMVGVMALIKPVSNMFKSASISEKTYSYANNVQQYLQTKLEYAENVYVGTADKMGLTEDGAANDEKLAEYVEKFRTDYFNEVVKSPDGGSTIEYVNGKIHVVRLVNKDGTLRDGTPVKKGQITHRVYNFNSKESSKIGADADVEEVAELNHVFLDARDAAYDFSYVLGVQKLIGKSQSSLSPVNSDDLKDNEEYKVLENDYTNAYKDFNSNGLSLTVVLNKRSGGTVECEGSDGAGNFSYKAFATPCTVQIVNLPLTNIAQRSNHGEVKAIGITRPYKEDGVVKMQGVGIFKPKEAFQNITNNIVDLDHDIYFIYCFTDEIES
jgi:prepilin-type N-terminal cleavage/methylation domain-containing protein